MVFDRCWLVLSGNGDKPSAAVKIIPSWWGLLLFRNGPTIERMAYRNKNLSTGVLAEQLWKINLVRLLRANGHKFKGGVPYKHHLLKIVIEEIPVDVIKEQVITQWTRHKSDIRPKDLEGIA
jgi:hypothetical protein